MLAEHEDREAEVPRVLSVVLRPSALRAEGLAEDLLQLVDLQNESYLLLKPLVRHPAGLKCRQAVCEFRLSRRGPPDAGREFPASPRRPRRGFRPPARP